MIPNDSEPFRTMLAAVYTLYGKELSPQALSLWFESLRHYDLPAIRSALSAHVRNPDSGQFLPRPADVVKAIDGGSDDAALLAWAKVDRALRVVGTYATVVFDDPLIHYCVASLGGWIKLGQLSEDDWKYQRQPFATLYRGARGRKMSYPAKLLGISEAENGELHQAQPTMIGDPEKALQVLAGGSEWAGGMIRVSKATGPALAALQDKQGG